jgi:hypothetical protein
LGVISREYLHRVQGLLDVTYKMKEPRERNRFLVCVAAAVPHHALILGQRGQDVHRRGLSGLYACWLAFGFEGQVDVVPRWSTLSLVLSANIVGTPRCLHEQHEDMIGNANVLRPRLPLVRVRRVFSSVALTLSMLAGFSC